MGIKKIDNFGGCHMVMPPYYSVSSLSMKHKQLVKIDPNKNISRPLIPKKLDVLTLPYQYTSCFDQKCF